MNWIFYVLQKNTIRDKNGGSLPYICSSASSHTDDRRKKATIYGMVSLNHGQGNPRGFEDLQSASSKSCF